MGMIGMDDMELNEAVAGHEADADMARIVYRSLMSGGGQNGAQMGFVQVGADGTQQEVDDERAKLYAMTVDELKAYIVYKDELSYAGRGEMRRRMRGITDVLVLVARGL